MAKEYRVDVGRADGKAGDTVTVTAADTDAAREKAQKSPVMKENSDWVVLKVWELTD